MLVRWLVLGSAGVAALGLAAACTTFGTDDAGPADAAPDVATDTASKPGVCVPPAPSLETPKSCTDCAPVAFFPSSKCDAVVVSEEGKLYAMCEGALYTTEKVETSPLVLVNPSTTLPGVFTDMSVDAKNVYVTTDLGISRLARNNGMASDILPKDFAAPGTAPVFLGKTLAVQLQPARVLSAPLDGDGGLRDSLMVNPTSGLALDGDTAYWLGQNSAGKPAMLGPFPKADEQIVVTPPIVGFAVAGEFAFLAEEDDAGGTTTISRIALRAGGGATRVPLAIEQGKVESLHAANGQIYWVVRQRATNIRVLVSLDPCSGRPVVRATDLAPVRNRLSFSGDWAYFVGQVSGSSPSPIYRMKVK